MHRGRSGHGGDSHEGIEVAVIDIWTFGDPLGDIDLTGYSAETTEGKIGKVDEATYETAAAIW